MDRNVKQSLRAVGVGVLLALLPALSAAEKEEQTFLFRDMGQQSGLFPALEGIRGHAAGWGDADGDGWLDLYVATFHTDGGKSNRFFRGGDGRFRLDEQEELRISSRASASVFADLDNDGDLDLYVSSMPAPEGSRLALREGHALRGCTLFRNNGQGRFTDVSAGNGACPPAFGGRSATVLDFDGDGLLDILAGEDPLPGYNGSSTKSSRLFRNLGNLRFEDVSRAAGLPEAIPGLGVAAGDVNNDGRPDLFLAANNGGNVLLLNAGEAKFREAPGSRERFAWKDAGGDNMICGAGFADVNRDGWLDLVVGQHYERPWQQPVPVRLYLNRGLRNGEPDFQDVTEAAGLKPLPMKAPHVEVQDFDNDGWPDLSVSIVKFAGGKPYPVIFKNLGVRDGLPRFRENALAVNDFPTEEDRATRRAGELFARMLRERKVFYSAPGPTGDYDNDGRLDMFLPSWWAEAPSLLLRNETPGGGWLQVQVRGEGGVNRMGIGSRIDVYPSGKLGSPSALLGCREIATGYGYASGQPAIAHFGLGDAERVDVEVTLPHGAGTVVRKNVTPNQRIEIRSGAQVSDQKAEEPQ